MALPGGGSASGARSAAGPSTERGVPLSTALDRFHASSLPTEAEEVWRYSRISQLDLDLFVPTSPGTDVSALVQPILDAIGARSALIVGGRAVGPVA